MKQPSLLQVLLVPGRGVLAPRSAAQLARRASLASLLLCLGLHLVLLAAIVSLLAVWDKALLFDRPLAAIWTLWHEHGWFGAPEQIFLGVWFAPFSLALLVAALLLPYTHRAGAVGPAFRRSLAAVLCGGGSLILSVGGLGALLVWMDHSDPPRAGVLFAHAVPVVTLIVLAWIGAAIAALQEDCVLEFPPRCEGCGYDLTQHLQGDRCPECGLSVSDSLAPLQRRPGCLWERSESCNGRLWMRCAFRIVVSPTRFYSELRLRDALSPGVRFGLWSLLSIVIGAMLALIVVLTLSFYVHWSDWSLNDLFLIATAGSLWNLVLAIAAHLLVVGLAFWLSRFWLPLPDTRWLARVAHYEVVFAWVFCVAWGSIFASFAVFEIWLTRLGIPFRFGVPPELLAMIAGPSLVIIAAMWRYTVILRAIRWSNF